MPPIGNVYNRGEKSIMMANPWVTAIIFVLWQNFNQNLHYRGKIEFWEFITTKINKLLQLITLDFSWHDIDTRDNSICALLSKEDNAIFCVGTFRNAAEKCVLILSI